MSKDANKETRVLVSEIAKLFGLTNQTIHYYEEKKIIKPKRDLLNNYRYFNESDIKRLGAIKKYRNAEFSLEEAEQMCEVDNFDEIITKMSLRREAVLRHIRHQKLIADRLDEQVELTKRYRKVGSQPVVQILPTQFILVAYDSEVIYQDEAFKTEASSWFQNIFFTNACSLFNVNLENGSLKKVAFGMLATDEIKVYLGLKITDNIIVIDEGSFVTATVMIGSDADTQDEMSKLINYCQSNNYCLRGQPFIRTIFSSKSKSDNYLLFVQIFLPIY
ncbi:MAG: MerR family transcriptional regulator [Dethiosulfatibacter sp.]|nr:MerR family transcriptional regulator [Dethiosulfatibacter sp.]